MRRASSAFGFNAHSGSRHEARPVHALLLDAESPHEAVAELSGVAVGGGDGGLIVDAGGDEGRAVPGDELLETRFVERLIALLDASAADRVANMRAFAKAALELLAERLG